MRRRVQGVLVAALVAALAAGCGASRAYTRGERAANAQQWDEAVEYYRQALQQSPDRPEYKIALERAMQAAAGQHVQQARTFEAEGRLDEALREYRKASEFDPSNRSIATRAAELDRDLRNRLEASRPRPAIEQMREQVRRTTQEPTLNPTSRDPLNLRFANTSLRDLLNFIGSATGINVTYDRDFQDRSVTVQLEGVTLEQALQQVMLSNQIFYKVLNERTIIVATDNTAKRQQYEEQVIKTFFVSHADATELAQLVNTVILAPQMAIQPRIAANKTANTITVRASAPVAEIIEQVIKINDKPRAEIVVDVQILEVSRERAKRFGLNLTDYALGGIFSPEQAPGGSTPTTGGGTATPSTGGTAPSNVSSPPVFNANTISTGVSAADFYLAVPAAVVRFLESDSQTKTVAKPQLRGQEGMKVTLNLGEEVPVPSTTFTPLAQGGAAANPLTSFTYRPIGVIVEMTPRVTYEGDIVLDLTVENSARGQDSTIAGQTLPAFASRKVTTRLRLRDGESNLLAGLLREDERRSLRGFPGILRVPLLQQLFADNDTNIRQTDIVMLLTPRIVRSHQLTANDLSPIYIGTQSNMAVGGPPPIFGGGAAEPAAATPGAPVAAPGTPAAPPVPGSGPPGAPVPPAAPTAVPPQAPFGSSPIPGTTTAPFGTQPAPPPAAPPSGIVTFPPPTAPAPAPEPAQPAPPAPAAPAAATPPAGQTTGVPAPAQVLLSPPGTQFSVGGGPYLVPVSISGATRLSTVSLSVNFNPAVLRVRTVTEGNLLRQGGIQATFTQKVDAAAGRVDVAVVRPGDVLGVSGTGVVAALLVEAIGPGTSSLTVNGVGTLAGGGAAPLQFQTVTVTVK